MKKDLMSSKYKNNIIDINLKNGGNICYLQAQENINHVDYLQ